MAEDCCSTDGNVMILACSGGSNVGQLSNQAAVELTQEGFGKMFCLAGIVFIDVWDHREQAERFGIRGIPTQIFYDADGKEVARHVGFMPEEAIVETLSRLGVKP